MKNLILILTLFIGISVNAQWKYINKTNEFNEKTEYVNVIDDSNKSVLGISKYITDDLFILITTVNYYCDNIINIDISLKINNVNKVYYLIGIVSESKKGITLDKYGYNGLYATQPNNDFNELIEDMKNAKSMTIRTNQESCETYIYKYSMVNSNISITKFQNNN